MDPAVDVSLEVSAVWSGNPALSDSPRVMPQPSSTQEPYITTLAFSSIKPSDLGVYILTVQLNANSLEGVVSSDPVELEVTLSFGKVYINLTNTILSLISDNSLDLHVQVGTTTTGIVIILGCKVNLPVYNNYRTNWRLFYF